VTPGPATDVVANRNRGRAGRSRKRRPNAIKAKSAGEGQGAQATAEGSARAVGGHDPGDSADSTTVPEPRHKKSSTAEPRKGKRTRPRGAAERSAGGWRDPLSVGERPQAPWHPLPLSELLILVGAIGTVIGLDRLSHGGIAHGGPALFAGIAAVLIGTVEVTLREHLSGYRSHTLILTLLPLLVFHSAVILILASLTTVPKLLNVGLLIIDAGLGTVLFKVLRTRYVDARRERVFAGRR
jgi:hypothetical protein